MGTNVILKEEELIFEEVTEFEMEHTFECGQCFRWNADTDGSYVGIAAGRVVRMKTENGKLHIKGASSEDAVFWTEYLDLARDYGKIRESYMQDPVLNNAFEYGHGMRILNQEQFETIISFIISANNMMPRIKKTVESISKRFGRRMMFEGKEYYGFPSPNELAAATVEELRACGCGYRAEYIVETTQRIASGGFDIACLMDMPLPQARLELRKLSGIGPKVADCILLFSMKKAAAFPVDVWVKRVMRHFYTAPDMNLEKIRDYAMERFGEHAGIAQQYLFYYAREMKIGTNKSAVAK